MPSPSKPAIIIPSRLSSSRLAGKALLRETGKYLIQHVYEQALKVSNISAVVVATDHQKIFDAVVGFGGKAVMTSPHHRSGTDRVAEVAKTLNSQIFVNIQGDEPFFPPHAVEQAVEALEKDPDASITTLACPVHDLERFEDSNAVKVVLDHQGYALYFSRSPIPYGAEEFFHHVGLYVFRREALFRFTRLAQGTIERAERLEQLRALENGMKIKVVPCPSKPMDINTPEDYAAFVRLWREMNPASQDTGLEK